MSEHDAGRETDALVARVMGLDVRGEAFAIHCEGEWSVRTEDPDADPSGWMCYAGKEPVYLRDSSCRTPRPEWDGWLLRDADVDEATKRAWFDEQAAEWDRCVERWGYHAYDLDVVPHYSTDITDAMEVAHYLSPGRLLGLSEFYVGGDPNKRAWRAIFSSTDGKAPLHVKAEADTPALAICRAALMCCAPTLEKQPLAVQGE